MDQLKSLGYLSGAARVYDLTGQGILSQQLGSKMIYLPKPIATMEITHNPNNGAHR